MIKDKEFHRKKIESLDGELFKRLFEMKRREVKKKRNV